MNYEALWYSGKRACCAGREERPPEYKKEMEKHNGCQRTSAGIHVLTDEV